MSRIRANQITNQSADGAPTVQNGLVISGVTTSTTFSGSGANLTSLPAANITGTLPAISGANLTNLDASDLASGTVPTARLGSGTASSSTFLAGDSTYKTVTGTTINNNANNRVITGSGSANTLEGESTFTFDGSLVTTEKRMVIGNGTDFQIPSRSNTSSYTPQFQVTGAWNNPTHGATMALNGRTDYPLLWLNSGASYQNNSGAGYIIFSIKDGAGNYCNTASIRSLVDGTPGNNDSPGDLTFMTTPSGTCNPVARMTIDSNGYMTTNQPYGHLRFNAKNDTGALVIQTDVNTADVQNGVSHNGSGRLTVPVAGKYILMLGCNILDDSQMQFRMTKNGSDIAGAYFQNSMSDTGWKSGSRTIVLPLSANDYIESKIQGKQDSQVWNHLTLYLLG